MPSFGPRMVWAAGSGGGGCPPQLEGAAGAREPDRDALARLIGWPSMERCPPGRTPAPMNGARLLAASCPLCHHPPSRSARHSARVRV